MDTVQGATVVLTGASSGIGQLAALNFARRGAKLVLASRNEAALQQVANECKQLGAEVIVAPTDVSDAKAVKQLAQVAAVQFGRIDVWINNAAVGAVGEFTETPMEVHDQIIRTNLLGYMHGAHAVLPYFKRQQQGVLININSLGGWVPAPFAVAYTASKFGLRGFSEALRGELSQLADVHICDVFPAFIDTPAIGHAANYTGRVVKPLPPVYDPRYVADAMVSLAERPRPAITVGQSANVARVLHSFFPGLLRWAMDQGTRSYLQTAELAPKGPGNVFHPPADEPRIYGGYRSPQSSAAMLTGAALAAGIVAGLYLSVRR